MSIVGAVHLERKVYAFKWSSPELSEASWDVSMRAVWMVLFTHEGIKLRTVLETHRQDHCTGGIHVLSLHDFLFYIESDLFPYKLVQTF